MSRTYNKNVRLGIAGGSNTEYYRSRNRQSRRKNKKHLKYISSQYDDNEIQENLEFEKLPKDHWEEPTDGTVTYRKKQLNLLLEIENDNNFKKWYRKLLRKFKK